MSRACMYHIETRSKFTVAHTPRAGAHVVIIWARITTGIKADARGHIKLRRDRNKAPTASELVTHYARV